MIMRRDQKMSVPFLFILALKQKESILCIDKFHGMVFTAVSRADLNDATHLQAKCNHRGTARAFLMLRKRCIAKGTGKRNLSAFNVLDFTEFFVVTPINLT